MPIVTTPWGASCALEWNPPSELEEIERTVGQSFYARPRPRWRPRPDEHRCTRPRLAPGSSRVLEEAGGLWWPRTSTGELLFRAVGMLGWGVLCTDGELSRLIEERLGTPADAWL